MSGRRRSGAREIEELVRGELAFLSMKGVQFKVEIADKGWIGEDGQGRGGVPAHDEPGRTLKAAAEGRVRGRAFEDHARHQEGHGRRRGEDLCLRRDRCGHRGQGGRGGGQKARGAFREAPDHLYHPSPADSGLRGPPFPCEETPGRGGDPHLDHAGSQVRSGSKRSQGCSGVSRLPRRRGGRQRRC